MVRSAGKFASLAAFAVSGMVAITAFTPSLAAPATPQVMTDGNVPVDDADGLSVGFEVALVRSKPTSAAEDAALRQAVEGYRNHVTPDDVRSLKDFAASYPNSGWWLAVELNIGRIQYRYGYYSRAIESFSSAWEHGKTQSGENGHELADRAVGELLQMHAKLGHVDQVKALLGEIDGKNGVGQRGLIGAGGVLRDQTLEGLWTMEHQPGVGFLCGPYALRNLLAALGVPRAQYQFVETYQAGPHGTTLAEVSHLADQAKLPHRLVFRQPGEPVPVPSIIHWKVNHFAAIVAHENGLYEIKDPTFGPTQWVAPEAIDTEGSGYFLVPETPTAGTKPAADLKGIQRVAQQSRPTDRPASRSAIDATAWRPVTADEAGSIYGMGSAGGGDPNSPTPFTPKACSPCGSGHGMAAYEFDEMDVSLRVGDTPIGYKPPVGPPVWFTISYVQRQPPVAYSNIPYNVGTLATLNWQSFVVDTAGNPGANVTRVVGGGGGVAETIPSGGTCTISSTTCVFTPEVQDNSVLTLTSMSPIKYTKTFPNGSSEIYSSTKGAANGATRLVFLTQVIDPAGNAVTLGYDSSLRLTSITDAIGQVSMLSYTNSSYPMSITKITDPFGRTAQLTYPSSYLSQITDEYGLVSGFSYGPNDPNFLHYLTTPYGTTTFSYTGANTASTGGSYTTSTGVERSLGALDPLGYTEYLAFGQGIQSATTDSVGTPSGTQYQLTNNYLDDRDSYYWNKYAYSINGSDLTTARNRHWAHISDTGGPGYTSDTIESVKYALENRVWYDYPGQTTQNTGTLGAAVRGTLNQPADMARLLDSGQQLFSSQYNAAGNLTAKADGVGRQKRFNYAANAIDVTSIQQLTASPSTYTNIASYPSYNSQHEPLKYVDAAGKTTTYTYNSYGQLATATDAVGDLTTYNYYPNSGVVGTRDQLQNIVRNGTTINAYTYDGDGRVKTETDSEGWSVTLAYDNLDRPTSETFPDKTARSYQYTNLDLTQITDRQNNVTKYQYDANRNLKQITDPAGKLTKFTYYPDGKLQTQTDPNGNVTTWAIDAEERVASKTTADNRTTTYAYDSAGRLSTVTDPLKQVQVLNYDADSELTQRVYENSVNPTPSVVYTYDPYFPRLVQTTGTNGTIRERYSYYAPGTLGALKRASEQEGSYGSVSYTYDAIGRLASRTAGGSTESWTYETSANNGQMRVHTHTDALGTFTLGYLGATSQLESQSNGTVSTSWSYDTNTNDRRLTGVSTTPGGTAYGLTSTAEDEITKITDSYNSATFTDGYDALERLTTVTPASGGGYNFTPDPAGNLNAITRPQGTVTITPNALNQVASANGKSFSYNTDGDLMADYGRTYGWDGANRLASIKMGSSNPAVAFSYDAIGRRVASTVTPSGGKAALTSHLWCRETMCASTYADGSTRRYLAEGELLTSASGVKTPYYYGPDQVGSVRDVLNASTGAHLAHYDYDAYGLTTGVAYGTVTGTSRLTDYGYAGLVYEPTSGLSLANHRAYDPQTARWLSRDPIAERGGNNLYAYVGGQPFDTTDPLGLCGPSFWEEFWHGFRDSLLLFGAEAAGGGPEDPLVDLFIAEELEFAWGDLAAGDLAAGDLAAGDLAAGDLAAGDLAAGDAAAAGSTPTIDNILSGADPDTFIHLTPDSAGDFANGVNPGTYFARLGDVSDMTVSEYQANVVMPIAAAGPGQSVAGFVLAGPESAGSFTQAGVFNNAGVMEYINPNLFSGGRYVSLP